ncbi:MAG: ABC transporter permease [Flavobacteriia bacterium]|nr:ABC transporter permease [Flavobacteriia bacterium]
MRKISALLSESFRFAWMALVSNRLRTFLSLLGITIGIFAIIAVYAIVDSLERNIRQSVDSLGSDVVYVQKWPWGGGDGEYAWWKYFQRPEVGMNDFKRLHARSPRTADFITYIVGSNETVKMGNSSVERVEVNGVTYHYGALNALNLEKGRYFSEGEMNSGRNVAVLGADIASGLFPTGNAVGESVQCFGRTFVIIGVLPKEGANLIGQSHDTKMLIPATLFTALKGDEMGGSANIMFVSVRERTGQIGIQKALGATRVFILTQFLVESTLLSVVGGVAGLILVAGLMAAGTAISGFELAMSVSNVATGVLLSAAIGLLSGLAPASMAARLDPVEAIRFNQ